MLSQTEIRETIGEYHFAGMGAVSEHDVRFLCDIIEKYRPLNVFELGVASGMSTSFLLRALSRVSSDCQLFSTDLGVQYYVDPTKKVGYLVDEIVPEPGCKYELHTGCWSGDAGPIVGDQKLDLIFIDANHMHPWPTIDTLLLMPYAAPGAVIAHHDIALKNKPGYEHGIGPYNTFDEFPQPKFTSQCAAKNIGAFQLTKPLAEYENVLLNAMERPWTVTNYIRPDMMERILELTSLHYSADFDSRIKANLESNNDAVREAVEQKKSA